ncbi:helicase MOV-10 [Desarmillaria tabescens]|uniref:Helicase MOV-10 n=1 Tax=Armillaria tabescens TaxID=1929756 RepID=A0AA39NCS7_ARMTA|nr:helicase MOV-10 [Desarmillaria tabescens]KAK0463235.1 helicase MOV-10 [Desarmillaria tabescens]
MPLPFYYNGYYVPFGQPPGFPPHFHNGYTSYTNGWMDPPNFRPLHSSALPPSPVADQDSSPVDVYWRRRLAPLPGYSSPQDLLGGLARANEDKVSAVTIKKPPESRKNRARTKRKQEHGAKGKETLAEVGVTSPKGPPSSGVKPLPLDKYADVFIPEYLRDIQRLSHRFNPLPPLPIFPSPSYCVGICPNDMINTLSNVYHPDLLSFAPPERTLQLPGLTAERYREHWNTLLAWELDQVAVEKEQVVLWQVDVRVVDWRQSHFSLVVAGIRESHPHLEVDDLIHLKQVLVEEKRGSGLAFEGRVLTLRKREGFIHFFCPELKKHMQIYIPPVWGRPIENGFPVFTPEDSFNLFFNVSFTPSARSTIRMNVATNIMAEALTSNNSKTHSFSHRWLFPEAEDIQMMPPWTRAITSPPEEIWIDDGLNSEQRPCLSLHINLRSHFSLGDLLALVKRGEFSHPFNYIGYSRLPYHRTVVEIVHQILRAKPDAHVLVCAPSNPATDTLAQRLGKVLKPAELLRLNDQNRTFAEVPDSIRQFCYVENDKFSIPPLKTLMRCKVVVTSCLDAGILTGARCTNNILGMLEHSVVNAIHPTRACLIKPHWTHLLIDEAAQGSEPELLVPISVVLPFSDPEDKASPEVSVTPQLVLCGDPNQLGPIIFSDHCRSNDLDISLLERLFERPLYTNEQCSIYKPFVNLVKNYRSHPAILMPPSALFYNDTLEPCARGNGVVAWSGLPNDKIPLMFIGSTSLEECIDERETWYNTGEIDLVVNTIKSLLAEGARSVPPLASKHIGVIAPWREQVWKLRERLREERLGQVDVGTVEDYQAREMRVIIMSCVRARERFIEEDSEKGLGLIHERKRMNVSITRAKELLIVIGNAELMGRDPYWKHFLQFALRNKLYVGPDLNIEIDGNYISRLESRMMTEGLNEEEQGVLTAGGLARELLREVPA